MPALNGYLTSAEAARRLKVNPKTVSRWAVNGKLPFQRTLGGHRRYDPAEVDALVESLKVRPLAEGR